MWKAFRHERRNPPLGAIMKHLQSISTCWNNMSVRTAELTRQRTLRDGTRLWVPESGHRLQILNAS